MKPEPLFRKKATVDRKTFQDFALKFVNFFCSEKHIRKKRMMLFTFSKAFEKEFKWFWEAKEGERYGKYKA